MHMRLLPSRILLLICTAFLTTAQAAAQGNPVQLALFPPVQLVPENESVAGLRLSLIYGRNANMTGFDWGLVTKTDGQFTGAQWGFVGIVDRNFVGWQANMVSFTNRNVTGVQSAAFYNYADHVNGLQISLVNSAGSMKGIQIGIINIIKSGGFMPIFPIVNWGGL